MEIVDGTKITTLLDSLGSALRTGQWALAEEITGLLSGFAVAQRKLSGARARMAGAMAEVEECVVRLGDPDSWHPVPAVAQPPREAAPGAKTLAQLDAEARTRKTVRAGDGTQP